MNRFSKSNYYILSVDTSTKQLYFQVQKVFTDKRVCHGSNLCTLIRKYLYGPLLKKIHTPIYQDILLIYLRFIGDMFLIWTGGNTDLEKF